MALSLRATDSDYGAYGDDEDRVAEAQLRARIEAIAARLDAEASRRVGQRDLIEKRWLADLRQYHGQYEEGTAKALGDGKRSQVFINITRAKTDACEARISDMLFPTDDRNFGIEPTPVPELAAEAEAAAAAAIEAKAEAARAQRKARRDPNMREQAQTAKAAAAKAQQVADRLKANMDEARKRAKAMEDEIDDQLRECRYAIQAREVIRDACIMGTGIMKGPVVADRVRRHWRQVPEVEGGGATVYQLDAAADLRPAYYRVDPWNFFPDMDARSIEESEGEFERHLMAAKQLRKLARDPSFDADAIRALLREKPQSSVPQYLSDLRTMTGSMNDTGRDRYHVWEYHGPLTGEEMADLAAGFDPDMVGEMEEIDPLAEVQATVWFCQGKVLKFGMHPMDSGESLYSVFCLAKDDAGIFGYGLPHIIADAQRALNAGWRMMIDNSSLAAGPQILINQEVVEPADGDWTMRPMKVWLIKSSAPQNVQPFATFEINSHQAELAGIIELARRNVDEESNIPVIAQGEQGAHVTQTAHGMTILMNSVNTVFRRIIKNWDDDMTTPNIRRLYDWNMQFSSKEHIKGDYEVDPRGTSVLLVREMQAQNLMAMAMGFTGHPVLGPLTKHAALYRRLIQAHMLPADEIVLTDQEIAEAAAKAEEAPQPNPDVMKLEAQLNIENLKRQTALEVAMIERETAMVRLAAEQNMTLDQIRGKLAEAQIQQDGKERILAAEVAAESRMATRNADREDAAAARDGAKKGGGGSGGYISA